jgi:hypothetical protein
VFGLTGCGTEFPSQKKRRYSKTRQGAVAEAMRRAVYVVKRHPGSEPDSFRLTDPTGRICGVFLLRMAANTRLT